MAAVFPIASTAYGTNVAASPVYSDNYIPEIWSGKLIEKFYNTTVVGAIANTNYEGEIKNYGDTVEIRTRPDIAITAYEADLALTYERPSTANVTLSINKGYYFNTILDDVMDVQADINMLNMWAEDAAEQMKITIDTEVLAYLATTGTGDNSGTTAGEVSGAINLGAASGSMLEVVADGAGAGEVNVIDLIVDMGTVLDESNIPGDRWLVIPVWMAALIKKSELRDASVAGDGTSMLRNGRIGMVDRFEIYVSNLLPVSTETGTDPHWIFAGHKNAVTFATQMTKNETLRAESTFGQIMRGLQVYGRQVIDSTAMCLALARQSTL